MPSSDTRGGVRQMLAARLITALIGFCSTIIIARLLSPAQFGLAAMAYVLTGSLSSFRDVGLSQAMLRSKDLDPDEMNAAFWYGLTATMALSILLLISAPLAADYYGEPLVRDVVYGFTPAFAIGGVGLQHASLLRRTMRFNAIAVIAAVAAIAGLVAGLVTAMVTRNVWALVAAATAQAVSGTVLTMAATRWLPGMPRRFAGHADLLRHGGSNLLSSFMNTLSVTLPTMIAGPMAGAASLGHLNRAQTIFTLPLTNVVQPVVQGAIPAMAAMRSDADRQSRTYLEFTERLACVLFPVALVQAAIASRLAPLMLGPQWDLAGTILTVLAPSLAAYAVMQPAGDLLMTLDRRREIRMQGIADLLIRGIGVAIGSLYGIIGIAAGYAAATAMLAPVRMMLVARAGHISVRDQIDALEAGLQTAVGAAIGVVLGLYVCAEWTLSDGVSVLLITATGVISAFVWGLRTERTRRVVEQIMGNVPGMSQRGA